jgi:poly(3-hydroxybutyrate) depolymerase
LIAEVQSTFCAGAWIAIIILAAASIDAQLRETELLGFSGNTAQLINAVGGEPALHQLRRRRNALVHVNPDDPALTVDQQWAERDRLEEEARDAIKLMFRTFYMSPGL